jgi:pimeloyl-ACP methyl ester carboxylesterase
VPVFVLIHSPLVGPTTWAAVARELERRERRVVVPSLLGVADASAPQWRHVPEAVRDAISKLANSVVLIGHSGGGLLLPVIADAVTAEVAALIFVDAFLPPLHGSTPLMPPALMDRLRPLARGGTLPPWSQWFGQDTMRELVPDEPARRSLEQEMPRLPLAYFQASVPMPGGWAQRPCAYLLLSPDTYGDSAARARAAGWPVADIPDAHHLSIVTNPLAVADHLLDLESELLAE